MELLTLQNEVLTALSGSRTSELIVTVPLVTGTYTKTYMARLLGIDATYTYKRNFLQFRKVFNWDKSRIEYSWVLEEESAVYEVRVRYYETETKIEQAEDRQVVFCCGAADGYDCYLLKTQEQIDAAVNDPAAFAAETDEIYDDFIG